MNEKYTVSHDPKTNEKFLVINKQMTLSELNQALRTEFPERNDDQIKIRPFRTQSFLAS